MSTSEAATAGPGAALKTVPSMATVLARVPLLKDCGFDYTKVVHGEQRLRLHRALPPEGELLASAREVVTQPQATEIQHRLPFGEMVSLRPRQIHYYPIVLQCAFEIPKQGKIFRRVSAPSDLILHRNFRHSRAGGSLLARRQIAVAISEVDTDNSFNHRDA